MARCVGLRGDVDAIGRDEMRGFEERRLALLHVGHDGVQPCADSVVVGGVLEWDKERDAATVADHDRVDRVALECGTSGVSGGTQHRDGRVTARRDDESRESDGERIDRARCPGFETDRALVHAPQEAVRRDGEVIVCSASRCDGHCRDVLGNGVMELPDPDHGIAIYVRLEERNNWRAVEKRRDRVGYTLVMREDGGGIDGDGRVVEHRQILRGGSEGTNIR